MSHHKKTLAVCLCAIGALTVLSACTTFTPHALGISDTEWMGFDKNKQEQLKNLYYEQKQQDSKAAALYTIKSAANFKNSLMITVSGGTAIMPPFTNWYAYQAKPFTLIPETCAEVSLQKVPGEENDQIMLRACYFNGTVSLDPSKIDPNKSKGTIIFHYSPIWDQGFTYQNITTSGYVRLKNANVAIRIAN